MFVRGSSRPRPPPPKNKTAYSLYWAEHNFLRLGFKGDHCNLSRVCFRHLQTTTVLSYGDIEILLYINQLLSQIWKVRAILNLIYVTACVYRCKFSQSQDANYRVITVVIILAIKFCDKIKHHKAVGRSTTHARDMK